MQKLSCCRGLCPYADQHATRVVCSSLSSPRNVNPVFSEMLGRIVEQAKEFKETHTCQTHLQPAALLAAEKRKK